MKTPALLLPSLLASALALAVTGCSSGGDDNENTNPPTDNDPNGGDDDGSDEPSVPEAWTLRCSPMFYDAGDGCDCGCGIADPDCDRGGCAEPGCYAETCDSCYEPAPTTSNPDAVQWVPCAPAAWTCDPSLFKGETCECGCGVADPGCETGGCATAGCTDPACDACHNAAGDVIACTPAGWTCNAIDYGHAKCDCGCGVADPTCDANGCTGPGCNATGCQVCHLATGEVFNCTTPPPANWTCEAIAYGNNRCDCGCGAADLASDCDAGGATCTAPGCTAAGCEACFDSQHRRFHCDHVPPAAWTCDPWFYGDGYDCECGCGAIDADCGTGGCANPSCGATGCEYCYDASHQMLPACPN